MPEKDPTSYSWITYAWVFGLSLWGGLPEVTDENGKVIEPHRPAGNRYGIRYDELYAFIFGALANA